MKLLAEQQKPLKKLSGKKASDKKEIQNLPSVKALTSIELSEFFDYTSDPNDTRRTLVCKHRDPITGDQCNHKVENYWILTYAHIGYHLNVKHRCIHCGKLFTITGLIAHYLGKFCLNG